MWSLLRNRQFAGHRFRRQTPVGQYIVDFVCFERKLVVEIDGGHHQKQSRYDDERTNWLESEGFRVLRFWNNQVLEEMDSVLDAILAALEGKLPLPQPSNTNG